MPIARHGFSTGAEYMSIGHFIRNVFTIEKALAKYSGRMTGIKLSSIAVQALGIGSAVAGAYLVGRAVTGSFTDMPWGLVAVFLALTVGNIFLQQFNSYFSHVIAFGALAEMRKDVYRKFDELGPAYLLDRRSGDLARSALSDVNLLELYIAHTLPDLWQALVVPPIILVALGVFHWGLALAVAPFLLLAATVPDWLSVRAVAQGRRLRQATGEMTADIVDGIQGLRETLLFCATSYRMGKLDASLDRYSAAFIRHEGRSGFERGASDILLTLGTLVIAALGAYLVSQGQLDPSLYPAATVLAAMAFHPVMTLTALARDLNNAGAAAERVFGIMGTKPAVEDTAGTAPSVSAVPAVRFEEIRFRYGPGLPEVLGGTSFTVPAGKTAALVGRSGAGKTTCTYLLLRLWDPTSGSIRVDGADVRDFPQKDLRGLIAYVPQDVYLFNMSIADNIRIGQGDATDEAVKEAARRASALEFIEALPQKWDTVPGERGAMLSGGQRQRIAIARALLKDAPILVMDEAVSNLDTESEAAIRKAIAEASSGRTSLIIAHRPSTIRAADRIVMLENGRVAEEGSFDELVGAHGRFSQLIGSR